MTDTIGVYTRTASATPAPVTKPGQELQQTFAWMAVTSSRSRDPYVSKELAAEILEALAAVERGESEDLGDFNQYADEDDDED